MSFLADLLSIRAPHDDVSLDQGKVPHPLPDQAPRRWVEADRYHRTVVRRIGLVNGYMANAMLDEPLPDTVQV